MKLKIFIYGFFFMIFAVSCNKQITDPEPLASKTNELKAGEIGTTYYVAKTGSNSNSGSSSSPWLTIQYGVDHTGAGSTLIVRDGVYYEQVNIGITGTSGSPIMIQSENKHGAIVDGSSSRIYGVTFQNAVQYITFSGFEVRNCGNASQSEAGGIACMGNASAYITIQECKIHDIGRFYDDVRQGLDGM